MSTTDDRIATTSPLAEIERRVLERAKQEMLDLDDAASCTR